MRWAEELLSYNFMILYCKGSENGKVDILSRRANYFKEKKQILYLIFRTN